MTYYTTPGYNPNALGEIWMGQTSGSSTMPVYLGPPGMSQAQINAAVAKLKPATPQSLKLAALPQNRPMDRGPGVYYITPAVADTYAVPVFGRIPAKFSRAPVMTENPTVLNALVKITDGSIPVMATTPTTGGVFGRRRRTTAKASSPPPRTACCRGIRRPH